MEISKKILINAVERGEIRVAITQNGKLIDLDIERANSRQIKSNIYKGKISSIEPSLGAVFVNYGAERHGFLPLKEVSREYFLKDWPADGEPPNINELLKLGQEVVVQVEKEERGTKGAALTTFISLAGSYLVLMPNNPRAGGVSRRVDDENRDQLRDLLSTLNISEGMGVIIRTAGVGKSKEDLQWDLDVLLKYWEAIKQAAIEKPGPYLIHEESDAIMRALRDHFRQDVAEVVIDESNAFERICKYIQVVRPDFVERVKLYQNNIPLFSYYQIEKQIEQVYHREVHLPSGGSVVIDHTEALVSIDVNSAHATKGGDIEETALNTNLEAAQEVARQLRLRDLGGLIVIDFIDMTPIRNQRAVEDKLRTALEIDRARVQVGRISPFGLLEMSRQRLRSSLNQSIQITCPRCHGQGSIRNVESLALSIIHILQEQSAKITYTNFQAQVPMEVATFLVNEQRGVISQIEQAHQVKITIIPNAQLQTPNYYIKQTKLSRDAWNEMASYNLIQTPKPLSAPYHAKANKSVPEPVIKKFLDKDPVTSTPKRPAKKESKLKKIFQAIFGVEEKPKEQTRGRRRSGGYRRHYNNRRRSYSRNTRGRPSGNFRGNSRSSGNTRSSTSRSSDTSRSENRGRPPRSRSF